VTPLLLALAWAAVVAGGAVRLRPAPPRVRALSEPTGRTGRRGGRSSAVAAQPRLAVTERIGAWALRRAHRPASPLSARRLGSAVLAAAVVLPVLPLAAPAAALLGWSAPVVRAGRAERRRLDALAADLPDVVDLLVLAVGAGLTVGLALTEVARRGSGPLAAEVRRVVDDAGRGRRLADALDDLPAHAGEAVRPLVGALVASERYGAPLVAGLERLADEVRRDRRRRAEEAARKVPVKLLFPLVTCTLPAFGLLTVAPLVASAVRSLRI
jgi:tight adherence protein C